MIHRFAVPVAVAALAAAGWKAQDLRPIVNPPVRQDNLDVHETSATASLVGQFRTNISSWLWLRTDLYVHNGTEMRPLSKEEAKRGIKAQSAREEHHEDDQLEEEHVENVVTVVPPKERDFRGVFGDVERAVASYKDMHGHDHNDPKQAMPLFRLMTWLDPQFIQGWSTGANVMARERNDHGLAQAVAFLEEGIKANPDSIELPMQLGSTIAARKKDLREAIRHLLKARENAMKRNNLSEADEESLQTTYRWLAFCLRDLGEPKSEIAVLQEAVKVFPDDRVLKRLLEKAVGPAAAPAK